MPPYQGARARSFTGEADRVFAVSKVRLNANGRIVDVAWCELDRKSNVPVSTQTVVPVADVVDAIHAGDQVVARFLKHYTHLPERSFAVFEEGDGQATIALDGPPSSEREINDIAKLAARRRPPPPT